MELEPSFFRLHVRVIDTYTRLVGPAGRQRIEHGLLIVAATLFALLVHLVCRAWEPRLDTVRVVYVEYTHSTSALWVTQGVHRLC